MGILEEGKKAAIVTVCKPDGTISKHIETGEKQFYEEENIVNDGPVSHFYEEDGSLNVIEHYRPKSRLIILGGGHIALAFSEMAKACGFYVVIFDDRPMFANASRFPFADEIICDDFSRLFERLHVRSSDYVVIVTRGHKNDKDCIEGVLKGEAPAYVGMIGSRRRVAIVMKQLADAGYPQGRLDDIYSPIGLNIGAITPSEIAVSILAQIIEVKRLKLAEKDVLSCDIEVVSNLAKHGATSDALFTILHTTGSVPRETGAKMSMSYEGAIVGTIGGGCAESDIMQQARPLIREGGWRVVTVDMTDTAEEDGMVCGGQMEVLIERS